MEMPVASPETRIIQNHFQSTKDSLRFMDGFMAGGSARVEDKKKINKTRAKKHGASPESTVFVLTLSLSLALPPTTNPNHTPIFWSTEHIK